jgi:hypothetical protein
MKIINLKRIIINKMDKELEQLILKDEIDEIKKKKIKDNVFITKAILELNAEICALNKVLKLEKSNSREDTISYLVIPSLDKMEQLSNSLEDKIFEYIYK